MDSLGASFLDGEWDFFRKMFANEDHEYYSSQFLSQNSLLQEENDGLNNETQSTFSSIEACENEPMIYSFDHDHISNSQYISQENSYGSKCSDIDNTNYYFSYDGNVLANNINTFISSMDFCADDKFFASSITPFNEIVMEESVNMNEDAASDDRLEKNDYSTQIMQLKRKLDVIDVEVPIEEKIINNKADNQKKKPRVSKDGCMKNARCKKNQKLGSNEEEREESNRGSINGHSSSSNISDEDNVSQENSGGTTSGSKSALNSNGKTRASRGSATDPQSLYARKRRERINERLRILQNLVPNGTKVDISTMLEEAVNYVKFLQLQIKLLSSDDMWMYAPLAYNGLDIGLNLNNLKSSLPL
ncbi:uncharacterized protein [Cicer arietinum]|uniref:Transcription factor bHLH85-like n=1 Tax=Cicer arietinum TaxID=3827 RepID=A0A3Q7X8K5_CICAR|nr:transcription factor bHLH85-like [Cicer arietinum]